MPEEQSGRTPDGSTPKQTRDQVFISYCRKDRRWLERLQTHLKPMIRSGAIEVWDDTRIKVGDKWRDRIEEALSRAKVAVLLVSPDFLASDFCIEQELPRFLEAAEHEGLTIIWVPVSASAVEETPIIQFQAAIDPRRALNRLHHAHQGEALVDICQQIKAAYLKT